MQPSRVVALALAVLSGVVSLEAVGPEAKPLVGGLFEASGAAFLPGGEGVLFVDDGRPGEVLWLPLAADGSQGADVQPVPTGVSVADPEGITTDGTWVYVVGSLSRGKGASLARFRFDPRARRATAAESVTGLQPILERAIPELQSGGGKKKRGALNVEGLAWDPKGSRLLLGLRAPVVDGKALVVPVRLRSPAGPLTADNIVVEAPALRVPLGGSGIRSLEYDTARSAFQIVAGDPSGAGDSRLVTWAGPDGAVHEVQGFAGGDKPEGVTGATLGGQTVTVVLFDNSRFAVLR
jgi:hypothetical protein